MQKVHQAKMFRMKIQKLLPSQLTVYFQLIVYKIQMSHLEAFDVEIGEGKDVLNENLEIQTWSPDNVLLLYICKMLL